MTEKPAHIPVMLSEVLAELRPALVANEQVSYFDGTFGRGGHLRALLNQFPQLKALAFDRDPQAIEYGKNAFASEIESGRLQLRHRNFSQFQAVDDGLFDAMLVDLGVSSPQLDESQRGFSFYHEGPLDMRMDPSQGHTAADIIATWSEEDLNNLFKEYGEIPSPYRVTRAIVFDREKAAFRTTTQLSSLIERIEGWRKKGFHPATKFFMALRLQVNEELSAVTQSIRPLMLGLKPRGRLAVLTFHSLEDRIVKNLFKDSTDLGKPVHKKVIQPEWAEQKENSRARSAKLRVFERNDDAF